ncbi:MAG: hypothetical protein GY906_40255 [bacterium]|nr:hypothetical protein [bacterium]
MQHSINVDLVSFPQSYFRPSMHTDTPRNSQMEGDEQDRLVRAGIKGWAVLFACWSTPVLVGTLSILTLPEQVENHTGWQTVLANQMSFYYSFALASPLIYRFACRYRVSVSGWRVTLIGHLIGGLILSLLITIAALSFQALARAVFQVEPSQQHFLPFYLGSVFLPACVLYCIAAVVLTTIRWRRIASSREERTRALELHAAQLEVELTQAKLKTLSSQLQPHFLFNALNSISSLIQTRQNDRAFDTVAHLAELLRSTLDLGESLTVSLAEELELVEQYLAIERVRFPDRLLTRLSIPSDCLDLDVPALILQPIVENWIQHAVAHSSGEGMLSICARFEAPSLAIEIKDDGPGLTADWSFLSNAGLGLANVKRRLETAFGDAHGLEVRNIEPRGVVVRLSFPATRRGTEV